MSKPPHRQRGRADKSSRPSAAPSPQPKHPPEVQWKHFFRFPILTISANELIEGLRHSADKWRKLLTAAETAFVLGFLLAAVDNSDHPRLVWLFLIISFGSAFVFLLASPFKTTTTKRLLLADVLVFTLAVSGYSFFNIQTAVLTGQQNTALPPLITVTGYEIVPYVPGKVPELRIHVKNAGNSMLRAAIPYEEYTVSSATDVFSTRRVLEDELWSRFIIRFNAAASASSRMFMDFPPAQDVWLPMMGHDVVKANDMHQTTVRFYFLSRAVSADGRTLFDSCVSIAPNTPSSYQYCIDHND